MKLYVLTLLIVCLDILPGLGKPIKELEDAHKFDTKSLSPQNGIHSDTTLPNDKSDKLNVKVEETNHTNEGIVKKKDDELASKVKKAPNVPDLKTKEDQVESSEGDVKTDKRTPKLTLANQINDTVPLIVEDADPIGQIGIENEKVETHAKEFMNTTDPSNGTTQTQTSTPRSREPSTIPEKDEENEAFCEELCSSCQGSERVFDIAEPSCFCKVTTVKSVKCLEEKVTDDVLMKVIAYVETNPKSEEEKLVAQYLKEREDFSINRNRRCCGNVGAPNPRQYENKGQTTSVKEYTTRETGLQDDSKYVGSRQTDRGESFEDDREESDIAEDKMLGARKIFLDRNTARKALRAEETSSERHNPEEDDDKDDYSTEKTETPNAIKKTKKSENRKIYKYEPPKSYKSILGDKLQVTRNKYGKRDREDTNQNDSSEILDEPKTAKRKNQSENRKTSKYEPPINYKSKLNEKMQDPSKKYSASSDHQNVNQDDSPELTEETKRIKTPLANYKSILGEKLQEMKNKYATVNGGSNNKDSFVGNTKLPQANKEVDNDDADRTRSKLKSFKLKNTEKTSKSTNEEETADDEKKWVRTSPKAKKQTDERETDEKPSKSEVILSRKSIEDYLSELKHRNKKAQDNIVDLDKREEKGRFKSLDDLLYERELKRQQYLSSIRNKYNEPSDNNKPADEPSKPIDDREGVVTLGKTKGEKKSKNAILESKPTSDPVEKRRGILSNPKATEGHETNEEEMNSKGTNKLKFLKQDKPDTYQRVSKRLKSAPAIENEFDSSNDRKSPKKLQSGILGEMQYRGKERKPIVSPFIDSKNNEGEKQNTKSSYKYSKVKSAGNIGNLLRKLSSNYELQEPNEKNYVSSTNYKSSTPDKSYSDKDNELSGSNKNKQTLGAFISKIRALYDKERPTESLKRTEIAQDRTKTGDKIGDKKLLGSPLEKYKFNAESRKEINKKIGLRGTKTKDHSEEYESENVSENPKEYLRETNPSTFVYPEENEKKPYRNRIMLKNRKSPLNEEIVPQSSVSENQDPVDENLERKSIVDKYLKAKYSGVKPSMIREDSGTPKKRMQFKSVQSKKDNEQPVEELNEETLGEFTQSKEQEDTLKSKYLQKKQEFLERIKEKEYDRLRQKETLGRQNDMLDENQNTEPIASQEQSGYLEREISGEKKDSTTKKSAPSLKEKYGLNKPLGSPESRAPMQPKSLRFESISNQENLKKPTLKELLDQRRANKVGIQKKSNEPRSADISEAESLDEKPTFPTFADTPVKLSLKDKLEQRKSERLNAAPVTTPASNTKQIVQNPTNKASPIVSSQYTNYDRDNMKAIMDQNPQKHCQHCMEYINHMTRLQKEQMLGQKPFNTRSISSKDSPNNDENKDESAPEKFINCRCYENQNADVISNPEWNVNPSGHYVGTTRDAMVGQPLNMQDVSNTFSNIKTGLESSVQEANDKISKGYNDLKTSLQHQYEEASQKTLSENMKDASDKMSQKISDLHLKDTVVNGLSNAAHTIQDKYNGEIKEVSNTFNGLSDKVNGEYHHLTDGMLSQPPPNVYTSIPPIPYVQAKYIDPMSYSQFQSSSSGNA